MTILGGTKKISANEKFVAEFYVEHHYAQSNYVRIFIFFVLPVFSWIIDRSLRMSQILHMFFSVALVEHKNNILSVKFWDQIKFEFLNFLCTISLIKVMGHFFIDLRTFVICQIWRRFFPVGQMKCIYVIWSTKFDVIILFAF